MSGVGFRETGLDSLFASKPIGPGFEPCLGQSAKLAGAPKLLCLSVCLDHKLTPAPTALDNARTASAFAKLGVQLGDQFECSQTTAPHAHVIAYTTAKLLCAFARLACMAGWLGQCSSLV